MSDLAIKICGISTPDSLDAAIAGRASYAGFVFYPPSPRNLALSDAPALAARADGRIGRVGLFVNASDAEIGEAVTAARLDAIQLHGTETPTRAAQLGARFALPVWKAVSVASENDVRDAEAFVGAAELILFDAKTPKGTLPGGMGLSFDWSLLARWRGQTAWGLAGGLTPLNVAEALRLTHAPLVDTSSGVERAPGVKDSGLIAAFCSAARSV